MTQQPVIQSLCMMNFYKLSSRIRSPITKLNDLTDVKTFTSRVHSEKQRRASFVLTLIIKRFQRQIIFLNQTAMGPLRERKLHFFLAIIIFLTRLPVSLANIAGAWSLSIPLCVSTDVRFTSPASECQKAITLTAR